MIGAFFHGLPRFPCLKMHSRGVTKGRSNAQSSSYLASDIIIILLSTKEVFFRSRNKFLKFSVDDSARISFFKTAEKQDCVPVTMGGSVGTAAASCVCS